MREINFSKFIENRITNIRAADSFAFAAAIGLGPWLVPQGPAILFGYALYKSAPADMKEFKLVTAVAVAIGLIVAGAVSSHNAITSPGWKPWALVGGYIGLEILGLWAMSVDVDVKVVGTVASLLTLIVYLSRSSAKEIDLSRNETKEAARVKLDFQMDQARASAEHKRAMETQAAGLKHAERLAKIEAKNEPLMNRPNEPLMNRPNDTVKLKKQDRLNRIMDLVEDHTQPEIANILGVSLSTIKRDIKQLNGNLEAI